MTSTSAPLCVIPARIGSKRLPRKNILNLHGRPMLAYSVDAALESGLFEQVIVSTEDAEIAVLAEQSGAVVHPRPAVLAGDLVSATDVCLDVADVFEARGQVFHSLVCLQPSSPMRNADDIKAAWERFVSVDADYLVSVTAIDPHYFHWAVHETDEGWRMYFGDQFLMERPLLPPVYRPNGAIKIGRIEQLRKTRNFFGSGLEVSFIPEERSVHVAEQFDFDLAHYLMNRARRP